MWEIERAWESGFIGDIRTRGFNFIGRRISSFNDIFEACEFIYTKKAVLYKKMRYAQRYSLGNNNAAIFARDLLLEELALKLHEYFNREPNTTNSQTGFDVFHNELCEWFLDRLNIVRNMVGLPNAYYGNAQKMINIVFKYLACFDDYNNYADLFSYCHIPIDNYMLNAFIKLGVSGCSNGTGTKYYKGTGWYELDKDDYLDLVSEYRKKITKSPNLPFLALDFLWWSRSGLVIRTLPTTGTSITHINKFYK